jgi:transposase-like protein
MVGSLLAAGVGQRPPGHGASMPMHSQPYFHQELAALRKLERIVWPNGPVCPHCGATDRIGAVTGKGARPGLKFCCHCRKQFRATIGTMFEGSHVPLHKWFQACFLLTASENRISAHQLHRHLDVTYKTALCMVRRLDAANAAAGWDADLIAAQPALGRDGALPIGRPRVRWRRGLHAARAAGLVPLGAGRIEDEPVPWAYPSSAPQQRFQEFAELALGLGCSDEESEFDQMLRRVAHPASAPHRR